MLARAEVVHETVTFQSNMTLDDVEFLVLDFVAVKGTLVARVEFQNFGAI